MGPGTMSEIIWKTSPENHDYPAVTLGTQEHLLVNGEPAALILGALVTIVVSVAAAMASMASRRGARLTPTM